MKHYYECWLNSDKTTIMGKKPLSIAYLSHFIPKKALFLLCLSHFGTGGPNWYVRVIVTLPKAQEMKFGKEAITMV